MGDARVVRCIDSVLLDNDGRVGVVYPSCLCLDAEPQPIPSFVVGYDHDWLAISPHALRFWEKLFLEPYSEQKDIAYLVVCPDDEQVTDNAKIFFRELSFMYEVSVMISTCISYARVIIFSFYFFQWLPLICVAGQEASSMKKKKTFKLVDVVWPKQVKCDLDISAYF